MTNLHIRPPVPADEAFVFATWLKSLYYGNTWFREIDKAHFMSTYPAVLTRILREARTEVACLSDDPDVVVGYLVYSGNTLHYVYVKRAWRKLGVAKLLSGTKTFTRCTHLTNLGAELRPASLAFQPFL